MRVVLCTRLQRRWFTTSASKIHNAVIAISSVRRRKRIKLLRLLDVKSSLRVKHLQRPRHASGNACFRLLSIVASRFIGRVEWLAEATMIPEAKLAQVVTDLHRKVAQLKREKQNQMEVIAKQDVLKPSVSVGLWRRFTAWLLTSRNLPNENVPKVITERG